MNEDKDRQYLAQLKGSSVPDMPLSVFESLKDEGLIELITFSEYEQFRVIVKVYEKKSMLVNHIKLIKVSTLLVEDSLNHLQKNLDSKLYRLFSKNTKLDSDEQKINSLQEQMKKKFIQIEKINNELEDLKKKHPEAKRDNYFQARENLYKYMPYNGVCIKISEKGAERLKGLESHVKNI